MALLGYRIDSTKFSRLALLPMVDRSGPTLPPVPLMVWHFRHWASLVRLAAINLAAAVDVAFGGVNKAGMLGSFFGSSGGGALKTWPAFWRMSGKGL